jgi:uncharacterized protein Usg
MIIKIQPVVLRVYYWMPDYNNILQEFMWQLNDVVPEYPRVHRFLNHWHDNIEAVIETVEVSHGRTKEAAARQRVQRSRFRQ